MKTYIAVIGIFITIAAWLVSNADRYTFVYRVLAPNLYDALYVTTILKKADLTKDYEFRINEKGYSSLHGYVSKNIKDSNNISLEEHGFLITKITLHLKPFAGMELGGIGSSLKNTSVYNYTYLSVEFEDSKSNKHSTDKISFRNFNEALLKCYSDNRFHKISDYIFWVGIIITCLSLFVDRKKKHNLSTHSNA